MAAYYNEWCPKTAAWLRELIARGLLPDGEVDQRSIADVTPDDLAGFRQCHFFAGIGGWPYVLRLAGWPDDRPVWTGSCPCPPFSVAGKGQECGSCGSRRAISHPLVTAGWVCLDCGDEWRSDDRHLLPEFLRLVCDCRPPSVLGEQVASAAGRYWLASLRAVLAKVGYAGPAADLCSAGYYGAHIRQRLYFGASRLADAMPAGRAEWRAGAGGGQAAGGGGASRLADADGGHPGAEWEQRGGQHGQQPPDGGAGGVEHAHGAGHEPGLWHDPAAGHGLSAAAASGAGGVGDAAPKRQQHRERRSSRTGVCSAARWGRVETGGGRASGDAQSSRPPAQGWHDADWLYCRDGKWRPVEPGTFPLADEIPARMVRLRGYGNAIDPEIAAQFVGAWQEAVTEAA